MKYQEMEDTETISTKIRITVKNVCNFRYFSKNCLAHYSLDAVEIHSFFILRVIYELPKY